MAPTGFSAKARAAAKAATAMVKADCDWDGDGDSDSDNDRDVNSDGDGNGNSKGNGDGNSNGNGNGNGSASVLFVVGTEPTSSLLSDGSLCDWRLGVVGTEPKLLSSASIQCCCCLCRGNVVVIIKQRLCIPCWRWHIVVVSAGWEQCCCEFGAISEPRCLLRIFAGKRACGLATTPPPKNVEHVILEYVDCKKGAFFLS